jgi:hypothetical protein
MSFLTLVLSKKDADLSAADGSEGPISGSKEAQPLTRTC